MKIPSQNYNSSYNSDGVIKRILKQAEQNNYYDFNLLALSNAHIVNIKDKNNKDFIFAAKDGCMNDGARGVYNFVNPVYLYAQSKLAKYYEEIANCCEKAREDYPAKVCRWAAQELRKNSEYGDKIVQRRAEQNQYIGDLYDECH